MEHPDGVKNVQVGRAGSTIPPAEPANDTGPNDNETGREPNRIRRLLKLLGPGLITGASDDDPSGIGTYATAGASLGYATLWTAPITLPLMASVQFTCAKIGMVTGMGLAGVLRRHYSRLILYPAILALFVANTINAGSDIGAVASAIGLLIPVPHAVGAIATALLILAVQVWGSYRLIARMFKWLTLALFAYVGAAFYSGPDWGEVFRRTFLPAFRFDHEYLLMLVAILGTTISPYLFFWQASQEVEEELSMGRKTLRERRGASARELRIAAWDVDVGMLFCNLIFYFVILATAATLHRTGQTTIESAAQAAQALRPIAGQAASLLFAVGIIGAGFLAVPVLTTAAAYGVCEAAGWKYGLNEKPRGAWQFYTVIAISTMIGMGIDFLGVNPIKALFWTAVINGVLAPPLLLLIMILANNRQVMGDQVNSRAQNVLGWSATVLMFAAAFGMLVTWGQ